ncbi:MAG TPA: hypothetical protein VIH18_29465 [Candidatus Binatia bacterium]
MRRTVRTQYAKCIVTEVTVTTGPSQVNALMGAAAQGKGPTPTCHFERSERATA